MSIRCLNMKALGGSRGEKALSEAAKHHRSSHWLRQVMWLRSVCVSEITHTEGSARLYWRNAWARAEPRGEFGCHSLWWLNQCDSITLQASCFSCLCSSCSALPQSSVLLGHSQLVTSSWRGCLFLFSFCSQVPCRNHLCSKTNARDTRESQETCLL